MRRRRIHFCVRDAMPGRENLKTSCLVDGGAIIGEEPEGRVPVI